MSVKSKMIFGFLIILLMVVVQSYLIVSMNSKRDKMSQRVLALSQNNIVLKDRIIDAKTLEIDLLAVIKNNEPLETHARDRRHCYGISILLVEWYDTFISRDTYSIMNDALKQKIVDLKSPIDEIRNSMEAMKDLSPWDTKARMALYLEKIKPQINLFWGISDDFVGMNAQYYSLSNRSLIAYSRDLERNQAITTIVAIIFIIFIIMYSQRVLLPLNWLMEGVHSITRGNMDYRVRKRGNDELGQLADQFNDMSQEIGEHREHLKDLVEIKTLQYLEAKEELEKTNVHLLNSNQLLQEAQRIASLDMKIANYVQSSFFIKHPPKTPEWEISFTFLPMAGVSGDMYDLYVDEMGLLNGVALMDVSGHGISSALITMLARSVVFRKFNQNPDMELSVLMEEINTDLVAELGGVDRYYLTGILLRFVENKVAYVNAGHPDLVIRPADGSGARMVTDEMNPNFKGFFLGFAGMTLPYNQIEFEVGKGDTLLLFTDCISESKDSNGELLGIPGVIKLLNEAPQDNLNDTVQYLVNKLYEITGTKELDDDLTIIALRRTV